MSLMHWTPAMSVGIPELDADHRVLIKVINQLADNADNTDRAKVLRQCFYALLRYTEFHFTREEQVMEACGFPAIDHHKHEHRVFTERMRELARRFDDDEVLAVDIVNDQLFSYLKDWLNHHILIQDLAYRRYAEPHSEARTAAKTFRASEIWWSP